MNRYAPLLRNTGFRAIWSAAVISGLGDRMAAIALYLLIYRLTGSPMDLGLLAATQILPAIVLGPVTGLVCDRVDRKSIMVVSDLLSALVVAAIPLVHTPGQVYVLATLLGCGRQFNGPARMALLPDVVGRDLVGGANSLLMLTRNLVLLVGPALGGFLVAWRGTDPAFWIDAVTFVASAAVLTLWRQETRAGTLAMAAAAGGDALPVEVVGLDARSTAPVSLGSRLVGLWRDAAAGLAGVRAHPGLRLAFGFFAVLTFVTAMQQPLVVVFVKEILLGDDRQLGLIIAAAGLGGILGALIGGVAVSRRSPLRVIALLTAIDGGLLLLFAANRSVWLACGLFACFGALATLAQIALATFLQRAAPDDLRGRTFGWLGTVVGPLSLVAVFLGPLLAESIGVVAVLALCGAAELLVALVGARVRGAGGH
ncbi:MAG: MFS transporter [Candidatus Krumholzibacteriia bacterium]